MFNRFRDWRPVTKLWSETDFAVWSTVAVRSHVAEQCGQRHHWGQQPTREWWLVSKLESFFYQQSTMSPNDSVTSTINKSMSLKLQERNSDIKISIWDRTKTYIQNQSFSFEYLIKMKNYVQQVPRLATCHEVMVRDGLRSVVHCCSAKSCCRAVWSETPLRSATNPRAMVSFEIRILLLSTINNVA